MFLTVSMGSTFQALARSKTCKGAGLPCKLRLCFTVLMAVYSLSELNLSWLRDAEDIFKVVRDEARKKAFTSVHALKSYEKARSYEHDPTLAVKLVKSVFTKSATFMSFLYLSCPHQSPFSNSSAILWR